MRIAINPGSRPIVDDEGNESSIVVALFAMINDTDDVVFSGSMVEDDYDAIIAEMNARREDVWA